MSIGLLALLDDVTALIKASAAALDDIAAQISKTSGKVSGIVIDDAAVTPKYVVGLDPKRELAVIYKIAKHSLINKVLLLGPAVFLLGFFAPWIIHPLLMLGGAYLCFEGYEKIHALFGSHNQASIQKKLSDPIEVITPEDLERMRIKSAVRTDFILSAEIIAITYASISDSPLMNQIIIMLFVAVLITVAVYGFVGLIVKADDVALHMATQGGYAAIRKTGHTIVRFMPRFLTVLGLIGTLAMLWVGGEIIVHGIPVFHHGLQFLTERFSNVPAFAWTIKVTACAVVGLALGLILKTCINLGLSLKDKIIKV